VLCFIDNDASFVSKNELNRIARLFKKNHHLAVVSFRVLRGDTDEIDPFAWVFRRSLEAWSNKCFQTFTFAGTGFATRAKAFKDMGGFWAHLKYSREEEELSLALLSCGWEIIYCPSVSIRHYFDPRGRHNIAQRRYLELKNGILIFWRRLPIPLAILTIIVRVFSIVCRTMLIEKRRPNKIISAITFAAKEWRTCKLIRRPVSFSAFWRYARLHFRQDFAVEL
jgi:GT2 family glycosyltransferase